MCIPVIRRQQLDAVSEYKGSPKGCRSLPSGCLQVVLRQEEPLFLVFQKVNGIIQVINGCE